MAVECISGAFLAAAFQVTLDKLASRDIQDYFHGSKLKDKMLKKLDIVLNSINQVLEDAEERQYKTSNVMNWLDQLKEAIYEAELLLDEVANEASRQKLEAELQPATSKISGSLEKIITKRARHISWSSKINIDDKFLEHISKCNRLRCFVAFKWEFGRGGLIYTDKQRILLSTLKYLRVLSFHDCLLTELVDDIGNLKLLRYLDLSYTKIKRLPDSICRLHNLQTLLLLWCYDLDELPIDLHKLVNLRHLDLRMSGINKMPNHIGRLKHLRTLTSFFIRKHDVKELGNLSNLQGTLSIFRLENVTDPADAMEANLKGKKHLDGLVLNWGNKFGRCNENEDSIIERQVLEALQPNGNLKKLSVLRYDGTSFPRWFGGSHLPNLVSIALTESKFCFVLPPFGQLPSLKELSISCFYGIEVIGPEFCGNDSSNTPFRSLEILKFEEMNAWKEWCSFEDHNEEGQGLSCLKELSKLEICECPHLEDSVPKAMDVERLKKMASSVRTGGKGTMRRKKKAVHKTTTTDDKRLQSTLKRIGVNAIPAIEEVNIFKDDVVIQFLNPKDYILLNTIFCFAELQDILPNIIHQLAVYSKKNAGPDNLENLKKLAEQFQKQAPEAGAAATTAQDDDDDEAVPDLVPGETFEAVAEETKS
ncbi:putative disease resistance protein [Vigna angularis]|uniref:Nascent polypeptide-associated complex subunit beta n=1 Tax=Phaseolus angularis TaxID=3914 RepID=A0A8T0JK29_PHAAN|nr:putative disease resistance protein [Vigna angularis]